MQELSLLADLDDEFEEETDESGLEREYDEDEIDEELDDDEREYLMRDQQIHDR